MTTAISNAAAIAMLDTLLTYFDAGSAAGYVNLYTNVPPDFVDDPLLSGTTLLAKFTLADPAFGMAVDANPGAIATAHPIADTIALADGTFGWFRAFDSNNNPVIQGIVGDDMIVSSAGVISGAPVAIQSWSITQRES